MSSVPGSRVSLPVSSIITNTKKSHLLSSASSSPSTRKPLTPLQSNRNIPQPTLIKTKGLKDPDHEMVGKTKTTIPPAGTGTGTSPTTMSQVNRVKTHAHRNILTRKKRDYVEKGTMTDVSVQGPEEDLINGKPSVEYWKDLAEERRIALADALQENKELMEQVEKLEKDNKSMEEMLGEAKALADMLNTLAEEGADESGIGAEVDDL